MSGQSLGIHFEKNTLVIDWQLKKPNGQPEDLTGAVVQFGLWEAGSSTPYVEKSTGSGITHTAPALGKIRIVLSKDEITKSGKSDYQIDATLANGEFYTYEQGSGTFKESKR